MGRSPDDRFAGPPELLPREVRIARFRIGRHPVTFAEWDDYAEATNTRRPEDHGFGRGDLPVGSISWLEVQAFLRWLSVRDGLPYRLPSEAEWEYACRAGGDGAFSTGGTITLAEANFLYAENGARIGRGRPLPVESYPPNGFGLFDMHGSIGELVADAWNTIGPPNDGSPHLDPDETRVVCRGGSWDHPARLLRCSWRDAVERDRPLDNVGFRLALDDSNPP